MPWAVSLWHKKAGLSNTSDLISSGNWSGAVLPVVRVDVGDHGLVLEDQDLDVEPAYPQQEVGHRQAGDPDVGGGLELLVQGRHHHHHHVGKQDPHQEDGL